MGKIPQSIIDNILDRVDIAEVISEYIQLKKAGRNFKACCPFHNEKTPSFVVSPDKQIFHCFGCDAGGNVIGFVMKYENIDFPEAVRMLADRAGVEIPEDRRRGDGGMDDLVQRIYEANNIAAGFYQANLRSASAARAMKYLQGRGIKPETLSKFRIGCAPDEWEGFIRYYRGKKLDPGILTKAGLTLKSDRGKGDYDRFRNRIIYPIFNSRDKIVAFGARAMGDATPKYLNSPETVVYNKSNILYGLNFARQEIRKKGYVLIVEGYMDVIMPYQHGICNIVATSGTALTPRQVSLLKKHTDTAVMVFDSDQAGESASLRGLDILIVNGMKVRVATLPAGEDPDSFVRKHGSSGFLKAIDASKDLFDYKLDLLTEKVDIKDIHVKAGIVDEMLPTISKVSNAVLQSDYIKKLAECLGLHEASLRFEMGKVKPDYSYKYETETKMEAACFNHRQSEIHLLALAVMDREIFFRIESGIGFDMFRDENVLKVLKALGELYRESNDVNMGKILSRFENDAGGRSAMMQAVAKADITQDREKAFEDCLFCLRKEDRADRLKKLTSRLKKAQERKNSPEIEKILLEIKNIHEEKVV